MHEASGPSGQGFAARGLSPYTHICLHLLTSALKYNRKRNAAHPKKEHDHTKRISGLAPGTWSCFAFGKQNVSFLNFWIRKLNCVGRFPSSVRLRGSGGGLGEECCWDGGRVRLRGSGGGFPRIPKDTKTTVGYQRIPKHTRLPKDTEGYRRIPKDTEEYRGITKDTK